MVTDCRNCWLRKRPVFLPMSEAELDFMKDFKTGELKVDPGTTLMLEGSNSPQLYTVLDGMGLRYKTLEDGERQVISFVMPGDFIGLQAGVMDEMQHSVESTTSMTLCVFDRRSLWRLFQDHPERAYDLTWIAALEEHFLGEQLAVVGRMPAEQRLATGILRLYDRSVALGMSNGPWMKLPYTQKDLADALGLSVVHTNKTLKGLRDRGILNWKNGDMEVRDYEALAALAHRDPDADVRQRPLI
ncbi:Crp/Fnr family transcriptional regulator [Roseovarius sp. HI0049]|nr:Crp/Fnr family transcriptional regulator [Roseovarius sp. HI0049]